jgi:hypothetical protein
VTFNALIASLVVAPKKVARILIDFGSKVVQQDAFLLSASILLLCGLNFTDEHARDEINKFREKFQLVMAILSLSPN